MQVLSQTIKSLDFIAKAIGHCRVANQEVYTLKNDISLSFYVMPMYALRMDTSFYIKVNECYLDLIWPEVAGS